jgi:hypothetical protein
VDLADVPISTISAALPRLHTLGATLLAGSPAAVAGFFDTLLPRLRVFSFAGFWPQDEDGQEDAHVSALPPPLPFLDELDWSLFDARSSNVFRGFYGAQPLRISVPCSALVHWLEMNADPGQRAGLMMGERRERDEGSAVPSALPHGPLARVRQLDILGDVDLTQLLHAAPELRKVTMDERSGGNQYFYMLPDDPTVEAPTAPSIGGLVHPRLRSLSLAQLDPRNRVGPPPPDCAKRMRQRHFPRLRWVSLDNIEYSPF